MTGSDRRLGHFHGDTQVCKACCPFDAIDGEGACTRPDAQWNYYRIDVVVRNVGQTCDQCGRQIVPADVVAALYEQLIDEVP